MLNASQILKSEKTKWASLGFFPVYVDILLFGGSLTHTKNTVGHKLLFFLETCTDDLLSEQAS